MGQGPGEVHPVQQGEGDGERNQEVGEGKVEDEYISVQPFSIKVLTAILL